MRQLTLSASLNRNGQFLQIWHRIYESFQSNLYVNRLVCTVSRFIIFIHSFDNNVKEKQTRSFLTWSVSVCEWYFLQLLTHITWRDRRQTLFAPSTEYYHILRPSVSMFECDVWVIAVTKLTCLTSAKLLSCSSSCSSLRSSKNNKKNNYFCCCCRSFWRQVNGLFVLYVPVWFVSEIIYCNEFVRTYARKIWVERQQIIGYSIMNVCIGQKYPVHSDTT